MDSQPLRPEIKLQRVDPYPIRILRGIGWFVGGIGILFVGFTGWRLVILADQNEEESSCRFQLTTDEQQAQGEILGLLTEGLLAAVSGATDEQIEEKAREVQEARQQWEIAISRRMRAEEIC
jgi:hypothetical protein